MKDLINVDQMDNALSFLEKFCKTAFCPKQYIGKPEEAYIACAVGRTLGMSAYAAINSIAIINGRPVIWGDGLKGVVLKQCALFRETFDPETFTATCTIRRKDRPNDEIVASFSWQEAQQAHLDTKAIWQSYPRRMLQMRARGFAIRDAFPDLLQGMITKEEAEDYPVPNNDPLESLTTSDLLIAEKLTATRKAEEEAKPEKKTDRLAKKLQKIREESAGKVLELPGATGAEADCLIIDQPTPVVAVTVEPEQLSPVTNKDED